MAESLDQLLNAEFKEAFSDWQTDIDTYESQAQEAVSDRLRIAILLKKAPKEIRELIRTNSRTIADNWREAKKVVDDFLMSGEEFDGHGGRRATTTADPHGFVMGGMLLRMGGHPPDEGTHHV